MSNFERRTLITTGIQARSVNGKRLLVGRAAVYNLLSADLGGFREMLAPGTFTRAIREKDDVVFTLNHDANALPLGRVSSGTLELSEDKSGLNFRCYLPNTQAARDLFESVGRQDIRECSFAFQVPDGGDTWDEATDENGRKFIKRTVREVKPLMDVSAVLRPAYPSGTSVSTLVATNLSSLQVSPRALAEARSRGGYAPRPVVLVDDEDRLWILREKSRKMGVIIAQEKEDGLR